MHGRRLDIEDIAEPDASFDLVYCRDGLQFALDPARAVTEIARVTKPGGRAAVAVWAERDRNPWLGLVLDVLSEQLGQPVPPPGIPGPFSLGDATLLERLFTDAKFADVRLEELSVPLRAPSFDGWWRMTTSLAGPLALIIANLDAETTEKLRTRAHGGRRSLRGRRRQPRDPRRAAPGGGPSLTTAHPRRWHGQPLVLPNAERICSARSRRVSPWSAVMRARCETTSA